MSLWHPGRHEQDMGNDVTSQLQIVSCKGSREGLRCVSFLMLTVGQQSASHRKVQCNRDPFLLKEFYLSSRNQQHYYLVYLHTTSLNICPVYSKPGTHKLQSASGAVPGLLPVFVSGLSSESRHTCSSMYCLWLLLCYDVSVD